jgi:hypothetical protein
MKIFLKLIVEKLFGGLSWAVKGLIEYWKIWAIVGSVAYLILLHFQVRNLSSDNKTLSDTVFRQDSTIVATRSKYMVDSVNLNLREVSMQNTVSQLHVKNKDLERKNLEKDQLIKDLADGIKCKNIFGKIVNCKKKD